MLWSFTIGSDTDDNNFSSVVNESRNREMRDEVWSYVWDASMFQYACPTMTLSLERQPVCQPQPVYPTVLCAILSVKRRSCEEQAVKLREALNEKIDGVFHSRLPSRLFCSVAFISSWHPKKTASFWTWTGQVQAAASHTRLAFQGHIYLWIQSLNPTFRPLILGSI